MRASNNLLPDEFEFSGAYLRIEENWSNGQAGLAIRPDWQMCIVFTRPCI